jgi:aspartate kinase
LQEPEQVARIVMKFGGTSMAGTERIRRVAGIVKRQQEAGHEVAVVVSAMAGNGPAGQFLPRSQCAVRPAEYDVVVASGEQVTSGLLALTLQAMGAKSRSWLGWQLPIHTDDAHAKARIEGIDSETILASMAKGEIAVIPGFQGVSPRGASPRWGAAVRTPARWPWPRRSRPTAATSTPMSTASTPPIRASWPRRRS